MRASDLFYWVIEKKFGGMPHPEVFGNLEQNLQKLEELGIEIIITLTEQPINQRLVEDYGFEYYHFPIPDFSAPTMEQLLEVKKIYETAKKPIVAHCYAGQGRTGTILAALLVLEGMTAENAILEVRKAKFGAVESREQVESVVNFETYLKYQK